MEILGVDFSGAKSDQNTWLARGSFDDERLRLDSCSPVTRKELTGTLATLDGGAVAALDFPFSVPKAFARFWSPTAVSMPELWSAAASMELGQFIALRDAFVASWGEPKRQCDSYYPECYSCLHKANPNLVPMTFYGMRMLARLWAAGCVIPPLPPPRERQTVLLEVMPGAVLRALKLPYKGYKNGVRALELRQQVLDGLQSSLTVTVSNLHEFKALCMTSHDGLDAIVAAIAAALWARDPTVFRRPPSPLDDPSNADLLIEGWLYVPIFLDAVDA